MGTNVSYYPVVTVMASLVLSSCGSTQLSHTWRDATFTGGPLKKILVVAVRKNQERRRTWEDGFVAALAKHGADVVPSYRLIPETLPDTNVISSVARERNFDGIILVGRGSRRTRENVTADVNYISPESPSNTWGGSYAAYYNGEYYPGYPVMEEIVRDEIKVWAIRGEGRMIWTGVGEVRGRDPDESVSGDIISLIVPELVKQGVIAEGS